LNWENVSQRTQLGFVSFKDWLNGMIVWEGCREPVLGFWNREMCSFFIGKKYKHGMALCVI